MNSFNGEPDEGLELTKVGSLEVGDQCPTLLKESRESHFELLVSGDNGGCLRVYVMVGLADFVKFRIGTRVFRLR